ncbi:MAG: hypothetical protein B0D92_07875 [Spirochaeta sp. LUC14_002_19_P3]|nr:MAG: hypothetical protein B0D92_07875 [Spirochaeta sp. LUC14_002_19_P3]
MILLNSYSTLFNRFPAKVLCLFFAVILYILFRVNTLTEREIVRPLEVITSSGFIVSSEYPRSIAVVLRGQKNEVNNILPGDIDVYVNLAKFTEEGTYQIPVQFRKRGTALNPEALEFLSQPRTLNLRLEKRVVRSLSVRPEIFGFPAAGFKLSQFFVSPSSVTVVGPHSQMVNLADISTELIDVSGYREDFVVTTRIIKPSPQIEIPGGEIVEFRGIVDEAVIIQNIEDRELVIFDLPDNLRITGELPRVWLTVQGSQLTVEKLRPQDTLFYLDGSNIRSPGTYTLPVLLDIPQELAVLQFNPREVKIQVEPRNGESGSLAKPGDRQ